MAYITALTPEQKTWCAEHGIHFAHDARRRVSYFSKGRFHIDMIPYDASRAYVTIYGEPSVEADGPDCNDGEPVFVFEACSLKEALRALDELGSAR